MIFIEMKDISSMGHVEGLLGSYETTSFVARDGKKMHDNDAGDAYGQEWQVLADEPQLFMLANRFPQSPTRCLIIDKNYNQGRNELSELLSKNNHFGVEDTNIFIAANNACEHLPNGPKKQFCIQDVVATGMIELSRDQFYI
jgi:hypothetical protein